ncbi:MAG: tail fiber domain-containing protein [Alphaproteobacteria bacterium]
MFRELYSHIRHIYGDKASYMPSPLKALRDDQRGNIFFMLFGAVAVVGVLGAVTVSTMRGPLSTMVEVQARAKAESEMAIGSRLAMLESIEDVDNGDCDGDLMVEPLEFEPNGGVPTGGGLLPSSVSSSRIDPWGTDYGYCAWDPGTITGDAGCDKNGTGGNQLLNGDGASDTYTVIAIISAGPDQIFDTTCTAGPVAVNKGGDDIVIDFTYAAAAAATDGLWSLSAPDTAAIDKNLDVTGSASFSNGIDLSASATSALTLGAASMLFPTEGTLSTCNGANDGLLRLNTATTPDSLELCDDPIGWVNVGAAGSIWSSNTTDEIYFNTGGTTEVGIGTTTPNNTLDIVGTLDVSGAVTFGSTLGIIGAISNSGGDVTINDNVAVTGDYASTNGDITLTNGTLDVGGAATLGSTLDVTGDYTSTNGDITLTNGTLGVGGAATLGSTLDIAGNFDIGSGDFTVDATNGNTVITGTIDAQGAISNSTGDVTLDDAVDITGVLDAQDAISNSTANNGGDVYINDNVDVNGTIEANDYTWAGNDFTPATCASGNFNRWSGTAWVCDADTVGSGGGGSSLNGLADVTITTPADGQCLTYDNGSSEWINTECVGIFEIATNVVRVKSSAGDYAADDFVFGSPQLDDDTDTDHDARMFFDKSKGAFRAGRTTGTQWDTVGDYSIALGSNSQATSNNSVAIGANTVSSAGQAFAAGFQSTASGNSSVAIGLGVTAAGVDSIAMGTYTQATNTATNSMALGLGQAGGSFPRVSGVESFGIFMGDQSGTNLAVDNRMGLYGGDFLIDDNGAAGSQGCIRYVEGTGLQYSDDCTTFISFASIVAGASLWTDNITHITRGNWHVLDAGQTSDSTSLSINGGGAAGTRVFYDTDNGALRGGSIQAANDAWDDTNIGTNSFAWGRDAQANGAYSFAAGDGVTASGDQSTTFGSTNTASGGWSTALGVANTASGGWSTTLGYGVTAGSGTPDLTYTMAAGHGHGSFAVGMQTNTQATQPVITGDRSAVFFFDGHVVDANSAYDFTESDKFAIIGGEFQIDSEASSPASKGCIRYNDTSDQLEYSDDCSTYSSFTGLASLWTDNTTHITRSTFHVIDAGQAMPAALERSGGRAMWYPDKFAFRAGAEATGPWDEANIGNYSGAFGQNTTASGSWSFATGQNNTASGDYSFVAGASNTATGNRSAAFGQNSDATAQRAFAAGYNANAGGASSIALGEDLSANGANSVVLGQTANVDAAGANSFAFGLGDAAGTRPQVSGVSSFGIFMGDQSGYDLTTANRMALVGGDFLIDDDGTAGSQGCIRYTEGTGLEYSDDCSTFATFGSLGGATALSDITNATAANTLTNGTNAQVWNWALTGAGSAFTFGETSAATGGSDDQYILTASTLATSTATPLYVNNLGAATSFRVDDEAGDTTPFMINASGQIGVGTETPSTLLTISGDGSGNNVHHYNYGGFSADYLFARAGGTEAAPSVVLDGYTLGRLEFYGRDNANFEEGATIGTEINGTVAADTIPTDMYFSTTTTNSPTERMRIASGGNVGVGDFSSDVIDSTVHLQSGDIRLDGGAANEAGCIRFDDTADELQFSHDCSTFTAMGSAAGLAINDLSDAFTAYGGSQNVIMGRVSAADLTSGAQYNTFIGYNAGATAGNSTATTDSNTAVGNDALVGLTSGSQNIVLGGNALRSNTTGSTNTAIGYRAFNSNVDGSDNVALGRHAGYALTTGDNNILIGANVDAPSSTGSNQLNIGDTITADMSTKAVSIYVGTNTAGGLTIKTDETGNVNDLLVLNNGNGGGNAAGMTFQVTDTDRAQIYSSDAEFYLNTPSSIPMILRTNDTERLNIAGTGNIGIGDFSSDVIDSTVHLQSGDLRLDGGAANEAGCIRFDDTTDKLQFSNDCSTFTDVDSLGTGLWTDNTTHITRENFHILDAGLAAGSTTAGLDGDGVYAFFDPDKGAFRGGEISGGDNAWEDANIGANSFSWGENAEASGAYSTAMGAIVTASNLYATAMGNNATASGNGSVALGGYVLASGGNSVALGGSVAAQSTGAVALGTGANVTNNYSFAFGLGLPAGTDPVVSGASSFGIFMGDQSGYDLSTANRMALVGGDFLIDDDGTAGSQGCIRYLEGTGLQFSHDCSTYTTMGAASSMAINDLTDAYTDYTTDFNLYMGDSAGVAASPGQYNVAVGQNALSALDTTCGVSNSCDENTAIGYNALSSNTTGYWNTAIGYNAMTANTTGYSNIAIGRQTGDNITTGSSNIIIGQGIDAPSATADNQLNIGNLIYGDLANEDFIVGSWQLADTGNGTEDSRMFFDKSKSAFRAGWANSAQWDDSNIGTYSTAFGSQPIASGSYSFAAGQGVQSAGYAGVSLGHYAYATGSRSVAIGDYIIANGANSLVLGNDTTTGAAAANSMALGLGDAAGTAPTVTAANSFGIFMGDQSGYDLATANRMALVGGDVLIDDDGTAGSQGCIRYLEGTGLQFSHDCSTYTTMGLGGATLWTDNTTHVTRENVHIVDTGQTIDTASLNSGVGTALIWDTDKGALRGGSASGTEWDNANIGTDSLAFGTDTIAGGASSFAIGNEINVTGANSGGFGLGDSTGVDPIVSADNSFGIFMGDQSGEDLRVDNLVVIEGGNLMVGNGALDNSTYVDAEITIAETGSGASMRWGPAHSNSGTLAGYVGYSGGGDYIRMNANNGDLYLYSTESSSTAGILINGSTSNVGIGTGFDGGADTVDSALHIEEGDLRLDGGAANEAGCLRFDDTTDKIQYSHDCTTFSDMGVATGLWTDNTTHITRENLHILDTAQTMDSVSISDAGGGSGYTGVVYDTDNFALRGGTLSAANNAWDDANIGTNSFAWGQNTEASGNHSIALGLSNTASGLGSFAAGQGATASNVYTIALGDSSQASGDRSLALNGYATGNNSTAIHGGATSSGVQSLSIGRYTAAKAANSVAFGNDVEVETTGTYSMGIGLGDNYAPKTRPEVAGANALGIFMGDNDAVSFNRANTVGLFNGELLIDDDGTAGAEGCIRFLEGTGLQFSHDCSTYTTMGLATPAGANTQIQFNNSGSFGATDNMTFVTSGGNRYLYVGNGTDGIEIGEDSGNRSYVHAVDDALFLSTLGTGATGYISFELDSNSDYTGEQVAEINATGLGLGDFGSDVVDSKLHIQSGDIRLDGGAANEAGCIRFDDTTDKMQFSHDCSTFTDMGSVSGLAINDLSDAFTAYGGSQNVIMGRVSAADLTSGAQYNTFIGYNAGATTANSTATADSNTAVGNDALVNLTSGSQNIVLGGNALRTNTTGSTNTAIGYRAFNSNVDGSDNVALGRHAGYALTTGDNNILIGANVDAPSSTGSNQLNIGDTIYGDISNGYVGIGNTAPDVELDVTGDIEYSGTITDVSDMRLKDNIEPLIKTGSLLERIDQIDTYSFTMKDDESGRIEFGVMAQELENIFPELVHTAKDEMGTKSVNYVGLIAPMIEATKELRAENIALKSEMSELKTAQNNTTAAVNKLSDQVALLNKMAGNNTNKASMEGIVMLLLGLLGGIGVMLIIQRKRQA